MATKIKKTATYLIERSSYLLWVLSGILIVVMMFSATYGVVRRYVFHSPEPYSYEISTMFLLFSFVFAVAALENLGRHIRVDFVSNHLPEGTQDVLLNIIGPLLGLFFCVMLTWKGWDVAMFSRQIGEVSSSSWAVPLFPIKIIVPIGYGVLCFVLLAKICRGIASLKGGTKQRGE